MNIVDVGTGVPVVLVPGIQGRWEWMRPAVDALARRCRVVTFSLADEPTCAGCFDERQGFDAYVEQVREVMEAKDVGTAVICGVSYGGLIAARFARRYPDRVAALVLVSAIPPRWAPDRRARFFLRAPRLLSPLFVVGSLRMFPEMASAASGLLPGARTALRHGVNVLRHMMSPARMARRVRLLEAVDLNEGLDTVNVPTLVVTGDEGRDLVVPVVLTKEYLRIWPRAEHVTLPRTGHLGLITQPEAFAGVVTGFAELAAGRAAGRKIG